MSWGEIYNTSWWGIALDTARTVKARPDFFGSQLNLLTSEQPNLVVNGTFDTDSDWVYETGWSISGGSANCDGTQTGNTNLNNSSNNGIVNNKFYKIVYTISNYVSGSIRIKAGNTGFGVYHSSNGTYTQYIKAQVSTFPYAQFNADADFIGSIDNVSVQLVRAELDQIEAKKCLADWIHTTALKDLNN